MIKFIDKFALIIFLVLSINVYAEDKITIASWNIKNFGETKIADENSMKIIAKILSQFDIIAIQEISNTYEKNDPGCPRNEESCPGKKNCDLIRNTLKKHLAGQSNKNYEFIFSPHVKDERYLFVYDKNKIKTLDSGKLVTDDGDDPKIPICDEQSSGDMFRQPFYVTFKAGDFDFTLLTAHTSPKRNKQELNVLYKYYKKIQDMDSKQKDIILLGDLNADCKYLPQNSKIDLLNPEFIWIIDNNQDTSVSPCSCAYDRIIFTKSTKEDYTGKCGVLRFDEKYKLTGTEANNVSDHYPIWAEFYTNRDSDHKRDN